MRTLLCITFAFLPLIGVAADADSGPTEAQKQKIFAEKIADAKKLMSGGDDKALQKAYDEAKAVWSDETRPNEQDSELKSVAWNLYTRSSGIRAIQKNLDESLKDVGKKPVDLGDVKGAAKRTDPPMEKSKL